MRLPAGDTATAVDGTITIEGAACQAAGMCVLVDNTGDVVTSTNPGAATPTWTVANVDGLYTIRAVAGTAGAFAPFLSDDGSLLGYFSGRELRETNLNNGETRVLVRDLR